MPYRPRVYPTNESNCMIIIGINSIGLLLYVYRDCNFNLSEGTNSYDKINTGKGHFPYAALVLWKNLPEHVRNIGTYERFRTSLKTHLFNTSYMS